MDEKYLHLIWEMKRFPSSEFNTVFGETIKVVSFGVRNDQLAGPDFFYGKVFFDGLLHFGMIEIHVKSSDWYAHRHHKDPHYNNVVLHVVHEYDRPVIQNGIELPTIELKGLIDAQHYSKYKNGLLKTAGILCQKQLNQIPSVYLESMKAKALVQKLEDKVNRVIDLCGTERKSVLYGLLSLTFGTSTNRNGFERILKKAPARKVYKNGVLDNRMFMQEVTNVLKDYKNTSEWNIKGLMPNGHPLKRINELVQTLNSIDINLLVEADEVDLLKIRFRKAIETLQLSDFMKDQLLINAIVPYMWFLGMRLQDEHFKEGAFEILMSTKAENNYLTRSWKNKDIELKTAYDSQALIALQRYYCSHKNCLSCEVGTKLLKR